METTNIVQEFDKAKDVLDIRSAVETLDSHYDRNPDICIRFYGLNEYTRWCNASDIILAGGLEGYLAAMLSAPEAKEIMNRDWVIIETDSDFARWFYTFGSFDWDGYKEAREYHESSGMSEDAFAAGLQLGIPADKVESAYQGEFKDAETYAQDYIGETLEIPESLINYIDWDAVARDRAGDYNEVNDFYFSVYY